MAVEQLAVLKARVVFKWIPTVTQVKNWLDSFRHKDDAIAISEVTNLQNIINTLSAGINGLQPIKRVVVDYNVELGDSVICVGYDPLTESPGLIPYTNIILPDPSLVTDKEITVKRYCQANNGIITVIPASGKIQDPYTGSFENDYALPGWGYIPIQKWKSDGVNYQAI